MTDDPRLKGLPPDDIRVNLELHRLVCEAQKEAGAEEYQNFDPVKRPVYLIRQRLNDVRVKVIADYQAAHPPQGE